MTLCNGNEMVIARERRNIVSYETLFAVEEATYGLISSIVDEIAD